MELRSLGATGLRTGVIGLGTVKIGRNIGVKYPGGDGFELPSDARVCELFETAADLGVNLIDTAPAYGLSEERIGSIMTSNGWFGGRDRWAVATKVGEEFDPDHGSHFDFSPAHVRASVERSLRRLRTEWLDVVLVHSDGADERIVRDEGTLEALASLADKGLVRTFGISTKTVAGAMCAIDRLASWPGRGVIMLTLNPLERDDEPAIDRAFDAGVGVLVKKALLSGHAASAMAAAPELMDGVPDPAAACVRFATRRRGVSAVVIGTSNPEHLRRAVVAAEMANADPNFASEVGCLLDELEPLPPSEREAVFESRGIDEKVAAEVRRLLPSSGEVRTASMIGPIGELGAVINQQVFAIPNSFGGLVRVEPLGEGGMGEVWRYRDERLRRSVAVKVLPGRFAANEALRARLEQEARVLASLSHPNIAGIHWLEQFEGGHRALVLEFVPGESLRARLKRGVLSLEETLRVADDVLAALAAAHERGVIHRDLKPENIMILPNGSAKVLDFGIAMTAPRESNAGQETELQLTMPGRWVGTPGYISPEQLRGARATEASDLFAIGATLHECLSGRSAFGDGTPDVRNAAVLHGDVQTLADSVPAWLRQIIESCLRTAPEERPGSAAAMAALLSSPDRDAAITPVMPDAIPVDLPTLIGRDAELVRIAQLIDTTRLLTLTGAGGCGKTLLAMHAARSLAPTFEGRVHVAELGPIDDPRLVAGAIADAMGVRQTSDEPALTTLGKVMGSEHRLLVLDNCEHVLDECCRVLSHLTRQMGGLRIIATSLQAMELPGEQATRVPPLSSDDAVRLFVERARQARDTFDPADNELAHIRSICDRLDGIPLAIELAAARVRAMSVLEIAGHLERGFGLLRGRGRTMDAVIEWSYKQLTDEQRACLERLSVFQGEWTVSGAEAVCDERSSAGSLLLLLELVGCSLVQFDDSVEPGRYRMLKTVRAFVSNRLEEHQDAASRQRLRERFVEHMLGTVEAAAWDETALTAWVESISPDHENIRHALALCRDHGMHAVGLRLASAMHRFWIFREHLSEALEWLATFLDASTPPDLHAARAWNARGIVCWHAGLRDDARESYERALPIWESLGDLRGMGRSLSNLGVLLADAGEVERGIESHARAVASYRDAGDELGEAQARLNLGYLHAVAGDDDAAAHEFDAALPVFRTHHDMYRIAVAAQNLGEHCYRTDGNLDEAVQLFRESLALKRRLGNRRGMAITLMWLGMAQGRHGELAASVELLGAAAHLREETGSSIHDADAVHHDAMMQLLTTSLDSQAFESAWADGATAVEAIIRATCDAFDAECLTASR